MADTPRRPVALITGASSGVGRGLALAFAAAGVRVAAAARRSELLDSLVGEISAAGGVAMAVRYDVEDEASIMTAYDTIEAAFGTVDTVIANAGVNKASSALKMETDTLDWIWRVNVRGAYLTAREGVRRMQPVAAGEVAGRVIFVASIGAHTILPGAAAYCASKAAVVMLGRSLAKEWARRSVDVNVVCPGFMDTDLIQDWVSSESGKAAIGAYPRSRLMPIDDLSAAVLNLAQSRSITGAVITIDDGQSL